MNTFSRPIPILDDPPAPGDYHEVAVDRSDPIFQEPMVKLVEYGVAGQSYYARVDGSNPPYNRPIKGAISTLSCRLTIAKLLQQVNAHLASYGVEVFLWDAYRPIECHVGLWDFFSNHFRTIRPNASESEIVQLVQQYVSNPKRFDPEDSTTWPPHSTGASVDVTLRSMGTEYLLDMGSRFDEMHPVSHTDFFERLLSARTLTDNDVRLQNRRLLYWTMVDHGFTNYPYEHWHFDYRNPPRSTQP